VQNSLYVQVLHFPILAALLHGTPLQQRASSTLWRGRRNGITQLLQRAQPIFGWAAITLGIGPHSSSICLLNKSSAVAEIGDRFDRLATIDMGRKVARGCCGGTGSPLGRHLTMWPGPRPTSLLSGILIHPTVWPQL